MLFAAVEYLTIVTVWCDGDDPNTNNQKPFSVAFASYHPGLSVPEGLTVSHNACEKCIKKKNSFPFRFLYPIIRSFVLVVAIYSLLRY